MLRCAQRGCEVPADQAASALCPVCNNPLILITPPTPSPTQAPTPAPTPEPTPAPALGEDGLLLAAAVGNPIN